MAATLTTCERDHFSLTDRLDDAGLSPITGETTQPDLQLRLSDRAAGAQPLAAGRLVEHAQLDHPADPPLMAGIVDRAPVLRVH